MNRCVAADENPHKYTLNPHFVTIKCGFCVFATQKEKFVLSRKGVPFGVFAKVAVPIKPA